MVSQYYNSLRRQMSNQKPREFKKNVFISYARKDKELIQSFINSGENRDFGYWVDQGDIEPGANWKKRINERIYDSDGAILFITPNSLREDSPINKYEIPHFIKRKNDPNDNFQFFPVFLDYVDQEIIDNYEFISEVDGTKEKLFETYDIWNIEANKTNDIEHEMPSEMSKNKREKFWADLNSQMSNALYNRKVTKIGDGQYWDTDPLKAKEYKRKRNLKITGYGLLVTAILLTSYLISQPQESDQSSEVFTIGGAVPIGALTTGDCFNLIEENTDLTWNTYVQYRACNLLHDGEVFYHESQIDFGDNQVGYSSLLNLFSQTCNEKFSEFSTSIFVPENYEIRYFWDTDSQALGSKPFDMNCLTLSDTKTEGSYVEDITGVRLVLPNPGDKYDCDDFDSKEDAQIWFDLYFDDYGDIALLDINNNGIACDEIRNNELSTDTSTSTTSTSTTSTSTTTTTTTLISQPPEGQTYSVDGITELIKVDEDMISWGGNWLNGDYLVSINNYLENGSLKIVNFWNGTIEVKLPTPILIAGPYATKVVLNGEQLGVKSPFNTYYSYNPNLHIGNLKSRQNYKLEVYIVDAVLREHGPMILEFNGSDWNNDDAYCCRSNFTSSSSGRYTYDFENNFLSKPIVTFFNASAKRVDNGYFELLIDVEYQPEEGLSGFSIGYIGIIDNEVILWGGGTTPVRYNHRLNISKVLNKEMTIFINNQLTKWADPIKITVTEDWFNN